MNHEFTGMNYRKKHLTFFCHTSLIYKVSVESLSITTNKSDCYFIRNKMGTYLRYFRITLPVVHWSGLGVHHHLGSTNVKRKKKREKKLRQNLNTLNCLTRYILDNWVREFGCVTWVYELWCTVKHSTALKFRVWQIHCILWPNQHHNRNDPKRLL